VGPRPAQAVFPGSDWTWTCPASTDEFVALDLGEDTVPDETTILRFRHLLEEKNLSERMLTLVNGILTQRGLMVRSGTVVDATLIAALSSTKNQTRSRDPEMHQTRKGNQWRFGCKAHVGMDASAGAVVPMVDTPLFDHGQRFV